ncbi:MAG: pilus (MSHA type) biogenesis protein MshL [Gammaproteobacteria bacterium]|nr:MAG: pilus (MSHA type) biogenesis protein MshL [Gammaproteobacteria bacterium]RKZ43098.1 MAG: pilus (MSHA type) biogenesis protein MshL [Gammaproteobacteria bacterium]RKZ72743.1 MAG: pilus (MSHA type) biogenesis protein MshL [Gammaproteobacteria bacterium]
MRFYFSQSRNHFFFYLLLSILYGLNGCAPQPPIPSPGHLNTAVISPPKNDIPPIIRHHPFVPPPLPTPPLEVFTVVVDGVPVDKLLFALARDAGLNVDIHPGINGVVTLNAINQTLPQLLERIAKQVDLRYQNDGTLLTISQDLPYMRLYKIPYVNMSRDSTSEVTVATQIASTGGSINQAGASGGAGGNTQGEGNNSTTSITNKSNNRFWERLENNIVAILTSSQMAKVTKKDIENQVIVNAESGVITIRATHKQHHEIQRFLDRVLVNVQRQVLIEVTIAEVKLSDQYQAGIDWQRIDGDFDYAQSMLGGNLGTSPFYSFSYTNPQSKFGNIAAKIRLLEQFGTTKVLSSPKIMALNNQTAILKVVNNIVYFTTKVDISNTDVGNREVFTTQIKTVPIGLVMTVTPQISENDVVTLNIRPTITRIIGYKNDPNPMLADAKTTNRIPEIQVREIESILKINSGDVAVIGGLMQDDTTKKTQGVPLLSQLPLIGDLFSYRDDLYEKTELVIFLRPVVIKDASLSGDLREYQVYLPDPTQPDTLAPTGLTR